MSDHNGSPIRPQAAALSPTEFGVLEACAEAAARRREMLSVLAEAIGAAPDDVFYTWVLRRDWVLRTRGQHGRLGDTGWGYFFHGYECDLTHADGRRLRFDFGPGGRVDTFTMWGVLQFVMTSDAPWVEYAELKSWLAEKGPRTNPFGGDTRAMASVWDALDARGVFEAAAPELMALQARHTTVASDGLTYVHFPPGTPETTQIDCAVAHRQILSPVGLRLLQADAVGTAGSPGDGRSFA
jgi:Domain of unknown function (DUF6896)